MNGSSSQFISSASGWPLIPSAASIGRYQRTYLFAVHHPLDVLRLCHIKHDNRDTVVHAQAESGRIHHLQSFGESFSIAHGLIALSVWILSRVAIVDSVHFCRL